MASVSHQQDIVNNQAGSEHYLAWWSHTAQRQPDEVELVWSGSEKNTSFQIPISAHFQRILIQSSSKDAPEFATIFLGKKNVLVPIYKQDAEA